MTVLQVLSRVLHSQQPARPMPLAHLQGKSSGYRGTTRMQRECTSGSDAHVPTAHMGSNNSPCSIHHGHHNSTHHKHQPFTCGGDNLLHKDTSSL